MIWLNAHIEAMSTLYKHEIYCLHGVTGQITANVAAGDTTFAVQDSVLNDVTIAVGSQIQLQDAVDTSATMTILSIDSGAKTLTVDIAPGIAFSSASPTNVVRVPHWASKWTETTDQLTTCPEDASHPVQAGSARTIDVKLPNEVVVQQSDSNYRTPHVDSKLLTVAAGGTGVVEFSWNYSVTVQYVEGVFVQSNSGDTFDCETSPDYTVGVLTQNIGAGVTVLPVSQTVLDYIKVSYGVKLVEGATTNDVGYVTYIDKNAATITVSTPTVGSFTTAATVVSTIKNGIGLLVPYLPSTSFTISGGKQQLAGYDLFAGSVVRITYYNIGLSVSTAYIYVKYLTQ